MPTLVQISYALALADSGSFQKAAKLSFVTQPTLSMQLQKLEDELGVILFDRSRKPIVPTSTGEVLLQQFRQIQHEYKRVDDILNHINGKISGDLRLGIIPTMAPYIVPMFLRDFLKKFPAVQLYLFELTTDEIVTGLKKGQLDAGILATPLDDGQIIEEFLFNEPLRLFHSSDARFAKQKVKVKLKDLPMDEIVMMNEGHCLRNQVLDLCELGAAAAGKGFVMETGSVATLMRVVEQGPYFTVLPHLCLQEVSAEKQRSQVKDFDDLLPFREVSLVTYRRDLKRNITQALMSVLKDNIPTDLTKNAAVAARGRLMPP